MLCQLVGSAVKKLSNVQNLKFGALSGLLLLSTIVLGGSENNNSLLAQNSGSTVQEKELPDSDRVFPTTSPGTRDSGANVGSPDSSISGESESQSTTQDDEKSIGDEDVSETDDEQKDSASNIGLDTPIGIADMTMSTISEAFTAAGLPTPDSDT